MPLDYTDVNEFDIRLDGFGVQPNAARIKATTRNELPHQAEVITNYRADAGFSCNLECTYSSYWINPNKMADFELRTAEPEFFGVTNLTGTPVTTDSSSTLVRFSSKDWTESNYTITFTKQIMLGGTPVDLHEYASFVLNGYIENHVSYYKVR